jgi:T-complex protein 1 subunit zeta
MSAVNSLNADADVIDKQLALSLNIAAAKSLAGILKTNLGPRGTLKMLVSGAGDIALTKDGNVLLKQMQIQHPTAALIARTATAQDDAVGDGTTSCVLLVGELLKQAERYIAEGVHPRLIADGMELARDHALTVLDGLKVTSNAESKSLLLDVARSSLRTKLDERLADHFAEIVTDAVLLIRKENSPLDLHMIEIMEMKHHSEFESRLVKGLVLDHGARHPNMSKRSKNCYILIANVSLEYEKSEINSGFFYGNAEERERLVVAEREFTTQKVRKVIDLKNLVCGDDESKSFVVINQKGIDAPSLDLMQKHGIIGIRRAKRRNMERLSLACGGYAVNSVDDLDPKCLGFAEEVYEHVLGEDKFTFIEGVQNPRSCTILVKGPHKHSLSRIKDAIRDGVRAIKNAIEDKCVIPGAGAFEVAAHLDLLEFRNSVAGRKKLGVQVFADSLLIIPKTLAANAGYDSQDVLLTVLDEARKKLKVGVDLTTGKATVALDAGIIDSYSVKRQLLQLSTIIASKLLLVDEIMRASKVNQKPSGEGAPGGMED